MEQENENNQITQNNKDENKLNKINFKYQINYSEIMKNVNDYYYNDKNYSLSQYCINFSLSLSYIDKENKINFYSILFLIYNKYDKIDICINIIEKLINLNKKKILKYLLTLSEKLLMKKNYFYSLRYIQNSLFIMQNYQISDNKFDSFNKDCINCLEQYLNNAKNKFEKNKSMNIEILQKIKNILSNNNPIDNNNENENNENDNNYVYLINKKWVNKALKFIDKYIEIFSDDNEVENLFENAFNFRFVYLNYFGDNYSGIVFPGTINNFEITAFKDYLEEKDENFLSDNYY